MNETLKQLRAFLMALDAKQQAKERWKTVKAGQKDYQQVREAFLRADEVAEALFGELYASLLAAYRGDEIEEVLDAMEREEKARLTAVLTERGLVNLLQERADGFEALLRQTRKASALWTATKQINQLRISSYSNTVFKKDVFEAGLLDMPVNLNGRAWSKSVAALREQVASLSAEFPEAAHDEVVRHVVCQLEKAARVAYDKVSGRLVSVMQDLVARGTFDHAVAALESHELRQSARDFLSHVPLPQRQTQTKPQTRSRWVEE